MYEREVQALIEHTWQVGPSSVRVETIQLWEAFPMQISESVAHQIWLQAIRKMGALTATQPTHDRYWHFP